MFRLKPHTHQKRSEGSNKSCATQDPEASQRLRQNCVYNVDSVSAWGLWSGFSVEQDLRLFFRLASLRGWEVTWTPDPVRLVLGT